MGDEKFIFMEDPTDFPQKIKTHSTIKTIGKILSVDDDLSYQQSLLYSLRDFVDKGDVEEILTANSASEAATMIAQNDEIAVILLDVVMEDDDAGLRLVETIRNIQGNSLVRIVLLTGQPGVAPRKDVMQKYDIDEYWNKSEIDYDILKAVVASNLRSWRSMYQLEQARIGLQLVIDASRQLASQYDKKSFIQVVLKQVASIIDGGEGESTLCVATHVTNDSLEQSYVLAYSGHENVPVGKPLPPVLLDKFGDLYQEAISEHSHKFNDNLSILCFSNEQQQSNCYFILAEGQQPLSEYSIHLLQVFGENISSGFMKIALINQLSNLAYLDSELQIYNQNWLLRELQNMNSVDRNNTQLVIFSIDNFDSQALTLSEDSLLQVITHTYHKISELYHHPMAFSRIESSIFSVLCNKNEAIDDSELVEFTNQINEVDGEIRNYTLTIIKVDLSHMSSFSAMQILYLSKSLLYYARQKGVGFMAYGAWYRERLLTEYQILNDLKAAIEEDEFFLELQPKIDLHNDRPVGLEALLRWKKQGAVIPPDTFIPIAENSGIITKLDAIALNLTLEAIKALGKHGYKLPISFNATVKDLYESSYIQLIEDAIAVEHIDPELLDVEITETQAMDSYAKVNPILEHLHDLHVHVSIDDFGTGYSSLAHISKLAADTIKIDKTFVTNLRENRANQQVVELVINLASLFNFSVVAEGIETQEEKETLLKKRVPYRARFPLC
ncbi:EAL domain-containing protein [Vibrio sp. CAIM 722]|uniref:EAL domain-containing protein n=1 Tax=Vibrio eleionomae TaxID=2653505 RepID=A0A7X4LNE9_9VIBR|nr:EAL domain-containing protein [Vibrio eleionomae]MZI94857.1 EAL domain-containing protein [Vibrio eleionomae]